MVKCKKSISLLNSSFQPYKHFKPYFSILYYNSILVRLDYTAGKCVYRPENKVETMHFWNIFLSPFLVK
jgi:hypothetical protein